MDATERTRLVDQLRDLKEQCEIVAEAAASVDEMDRYPTDTVRFLTDVAKEAVDLKHRILNELISAGPEVDKWRDLIGAMEFTESYRIDEDFRRSSDRPNIRDLRTAGCILESVCRHFGIEPQTPKKRTGRRGPQADMEWHRQVVTIVGDGPITPDDLPDICKRLDRASVHVPKKWRKKDGVKTWTEALELKDKWHIIEALNYSRDMTSKHPNR
jgi:hypothetical protein